MFVEFKDLPDSARIWVYQADRELGEAEQARILDFLAKAVDSWLTHGMPMRGSARVAFNRLIILAADTAFCPPSGCSIDTSTGWLAELGKSMGLDFFNRSIGYFEDNKLKFFSVFEAKKQVAAGTVGPDTPVVNLQAATINDPLVIPASQSFLNRYFVLSNSR